MSGDKNTLVAISSIGDIFVIDLRDLTVKEGLPRFSSPYQYIDFAYNRRVDGRLGRYVFNENGRFVEFQDYPGDPALLQKYKDCLKTTFNPLKHGLNSNSRVAALSPNGRYLAVSEWVTGDEPANAIRVFDLKFNTVMASFDAQEFDFKSNRSMLVDYLGFTPDGECLVAVSQGGTLYRKKGQPQVGNDIKVWRVSNGDVVYTPRGKMGVPLFDLAVSLDSKQVAVRGESGGLRVLDLESKRVKAFNGVDLRGVTALKATRSGFVVGLSDGSFYHVNSNRHVHGYFKEKITDIIDLGDRLAVSSDDGSVKVFDAGPMTYLYSVVSLLKDNYLIANSDNYYISSPEAGKYVRFKKDNTFYSFEDYDLTRNRPDLVLNTIGFTSPGVIDFYQALHERRNQLFNQGNLSAESGIDLAQTRPEFDITNDVPFVVNTNKLNLTFDYDGHGVGIASVHARVNGVPLFGTTGKKISVRASSQNKMTVPLVFGRNKIDLFAIDNNGVRSKKSTVFTNNIREQVTNLYVVSIGVSDYTDNRLDLKYAAKDAHDVATSLLSQYDQKTINKAYKLVITNKGATKDNILAKTRSFLAKAKFNDIVVLFLAGHGFSENGQYFFAGNDINIDKVVDSGLPFDTLDALLSSITPNRKLMLFDTCFSGQEDLYNSAESKLLLSSNVRSRSIPISRGLTRKKGPSIRSEVVERLAFNNLSQGSGAIVLSSSGQQEFSYEDGTYKNGIFTYSLLKSLSDKTSDLDGDGSLSIREIETYISDKVGVLTAGQQQPNIRNENVNMNFELVSQ